MAGEKILVIDDSKDQRDFLSDYLKLRDYRVILAMDGLQGLQKAREYRPDLILLDLQMPRMDGTEVLRRLKAENIDAPVILMTAHGTEEIAVEVFRQGVKDYLIKPYTFEDLDAALDRCLGESRWRRDEARLRREKDEITEKLLQSNARFNKRQRDLRILFSVGKSVAAQLELDALLLRIVGAAAMLTSSQSGGLFLFEGGQLVCRAVKGDNDERPRVTHSLISDSLAEQALATKQLTFEYPDAVHNGQGGGSTAPATGMAVPIISAHRGLGVLVVRVPEMLRYTEYDGELLSALADYAAIAVDRVAQPDDPLETSAEPVRLMVPSPQQPTKSIFVSYSHANWNEFVEPLVEQMRTEGLQVWIDKDAMESGEDWLDKINELLEASDYLVLCVTPEALLSPIVRMEYRYFFHRKKRILPLICKPANLPAELLGIQHEPYENSDRLIRWLKRRMSS